MKWEMAKDGYVYEYETYQMPHARGILELNCERKFRRISKILHNSCQTLQQYEHLTNAGNSRYSNTVNLV